MLPAGEPVSSKLQGEGEPRAVPEAQPGEAPTPEHKQAIADLHEPPADLPKGGPLLGSYLVHCRQRLAAPPASTLRSQCMQVGRAAWAPTSARQAPEC